MRPGVLDGVAEVQEGAGQVHVDGLLSGDGEEQALSTQVPRQPLVPLCLTPTRERERGRGKKYINMQDFFSSFLLQQERQL